VLDFHYFGVERKFCLRTAAPFVLFGNYSFCRLGKITHNQSILYIYDMLFPPLENRPSYYFNKSMKEKKTK